MSISQHPPSPPPGDDQAPAVTAPGVGMAVDPVTGVVHLTGELDAESGPTLLSGLVRHAVEAHDVVVDASGLTFVDHTAVQALLHARRAAEAAGGGLVVVGASDVLTWLAYECGAGDLLGTE
ncbi:STAS domain-containing protein [Actinotalea sp. AC32]|nr:STAS domain-containing protein [Actinotalea sp. AC32]